MTHNLLQHLEQGYQQDIHPRLMALLLLSLEAAPPVKDDYLPASHDSTGIDS